jgi:hypothetical protein
MHKTPEPQEWRCRRRKGPSGRSSAERSAPRLVPSAGISGVEERRRVPEYVIREHCPSLRYEGDLRVGAVPLQRGVALYAVPRQYQAGPGCRTIAVIVEPRIRHVVETIE